MSHEIKLIYGHMKFLKENNIRLFSKRSIVDDDMYVVGYCDLSKKFHTFSVTLKPVEYFSIRARSEKRMALIETLKNAK